MLASASVLLLMHMIVILMLAMSTNFFTLMTLLVNSISIVVRRISRQLIVYLSAFLLFLSAHFW